MLERKEIALTDFLNTWEDALGKKLLQITKPLHDPFNPEDVTEFEKKLAVIPRRKKPFPIQREVVKALAKHFYVTDKSSAVLVGTMGCGKTLMSIATALMSPKPQRTIVCAPPHLCPKWIAEIKTIVPDAEIHNLNVKQPIDLLRRLKTAKWGREVKRPEFYVISREKAKLSYIWKEAYLTRQVEAGLKSHAYLHCPSCGFRLTDVEKEGNTEYVIPLGQSDLHKRKHFCQAIIGYRVYKPGKDAKEVIRYRQVPLSYKTEENSGERLEPIKCGSALWTATSKIKRLSPSEYIKKKMRNFFSMAIFDECHELESLYTLQGNTFGRIASACRKVCGLSGTIINGYATPIFALLYRMAPKTLKDAGFEYGAETQWMDQYGVLETVRYIDSSDLRSGKGKTNDKIVRRRPGISPLVLARYLLDKTVFITLDDISEALPNYSEEAVTVSMLPVQRKSYEALKRRFQELLSGNEGAPPFAVLSKMLMSLLSYVDSCVVSPEAIKVPINNGDDVIEISAPQLDPELTLPKEQQLIDILSRNKAQNRRCIVFCVFTDKRDIMPRVQLKLAKAGFQTAILRSTTVKPEERIRWFSEREKDGTDVVICNPDLIRTGVDLYGWPTSVFYQTGYKLTTLRQASRRAYRINQKEDVQIYFLTYEDTLQEEALTLMAKKMEAALVLEGELPEGGLASLSESSESILEELARSLAKEIRSGSAEEAWKRFRKRQEQLAPPSYAMPKDDAATDETSDDSFTGITSNNPDSLAGPPAVPTRAQIIRFQKGSTRPKAEIVELAQSEDSSPSSSTPCDGALQYLLF